MIDHEELRKLALAATPGPWNGRIHEVNGVNGLPRQRRYIHQSGNDNSALMSVGTSHYSGGNAQNNMEYVVAVNPVAIIALLDELRDMTDDRNSWEQQNSDRVDQVLEIAKELETVKHDRDVWQKLHMDRCNELLAAGSSLDEANKAMHTESTRQMQNWLHNKRT